MGEIRVRVGSREDGAPIFLRALCTEEFRDAVAQYASLFGTGYWPDVDHASERFCTLIGELKSAGRQDLISVVAEVLDKPLHALIRSLRAAENPMDPVFEQIFVLLGVLGDGRFVPILFEMVQWRPDSMNYVVIREMAVVEALMFIPDSRVAPALAAIARDVQAPRSPRRCAVLGLRSLNLPEVHGVLRKLRGDPVVSDLLPRE